MLNEVQTKAVARLSDILKAHRVAYLIGEVRTGKTRMALVTAFRYLADSPESIVLIVTKLKAKPGILKEARDLGFPEKRIQIVNYESLHKVNPERVAFIVIDEAHNLGTYPVPSLRAKRMKKLSGNKPVLLMSGTPTPESWSQIYHQFAVTGHSPWKAYANFYRWSDDFVNVRTVRRAKWIVKDYSQALIAKIKPVLEALSVSVTQKEVGIESDITEHELFVEMPQAYSVYRTMKQHGIVGDIIAEGPASRMIKCHQLCGGTMNGMGVIEATKAEFIRDRFAGKKIAIYYKFDLQGDILRRVLPKNTTDVSIFEKSKDTAYISQIVSGREGVSLKSADAIVFYTPDFAALSYLQARARAQGYGKTSCPIYWIMMVGGMEKEILDRVRAKENFTLKHFEHGTH